MKRFIFNLFILSFLTGWIWFIPFPTVLANHEPDHNVDLILENARYIPNAGRFELTVRNVGPDAIEENILLSLAWYNENEELVIPVLDTLFLEELPFLGPNESRTVIYDAFNPYPRNRPTQLLFDPYGLLENEGIDLTDLQQPELRVAVDPFNMIPEMDETNNNNSFPIQLLSELELGTLLEQGEEGANLRLEFSNIGLSPIAVNEGIAITFEWLDAEQIIIEDASMINFYGIGLDFQGSGNFFSTVFNSADDPFEQ